MYIFLFVLIVLFIIFLILFILKLKNDEKIGNADFGENIRITNFKHRLKIFMVNSIGRIKDISAKFELEKVSVEKITDFLENDENSTKEFEFLNDSIKKIF